MNELIELSVPSMSVPVELFAHYNRHRVLILSLSFFPQLLLIILLHLGNSLCQNVTSARYAFICHHSVPSGTGARCMRLRHGGGTGREVSGVLQQVLFLGAFVFGLESFVFLEQLFLPVVEFLDQLLRFVALAQQVVLLQLPLGPLLLELEHQLTAFVLRLLRLLLLLAQLVPVLFLVLVNLSLIVLYPSVPLHLHLVQFLVESPFVLTHLLHPLLHRPVLTQFAP